MKRGMNCKVIDTDNRENYVFCKRNEWIKICLLWEYEWLYNTIWILALIILNYKDFDKLEKFRLHKRIVYIIYILKW